jgi:hypothetical protein
LSIDFTHQEKTSLTFRSFFSFAVSFGLAPFFFTIFPPDLPEAPEIAVVVVVLAAYVISCSVVSVIVVLSASAYGVGGFCIAARAALASASIPIGQQYVI